MSMKETNGTENDRVGVPVKVEWPGLPEKIKLMLTPKRRVWEEEP